MYLTPVKKAKHEGGKPGRNTLRFEMLFVK